jgi:hypothetical protein
VRAPGPASRSPSGRARHASRHPRSRARATQARGRHWTAGRPTRTVTARLLLAGRGRSAPSARSAPRGAASIAGTIGCQAGAAYRHTGNPPEAITVCLLFESDQMSRRGRGVFARTTPRLTPGTRIRRERSPIVIERATFRDEDRADSYERSHVLLMRRPSLAESMHLRPGDRIAARARADPPRSSCRLTRALEHPGRSASANARGRHGRGPGHCTGEPALHQFRSARGTGTSTPVLAA